MLPGGARADILHGVCQAGTAGYRYGTIHYPCWIQIDADADLKKGRWLCETYICGGPESDGYWQSYSTQTVIARRDSEKSRHRRGPGYPRSAIEKNSGGSEKNAGCAENHCLLEQSKDDISGPCRSFRVADIVVNYAELVSICPTTCPTTPSMAVVKYASNPATPQANERFAIKKPATHLITRLRVPCETAK